MAEHIITEDNLNDFVFDYQTNRRLSINLGDLEINKEGKVVYTTEDIRKVKVPFIFNNATMQRVNNQAVRMTKTDFQNMVRAWHKEKSLVEMGVYEARQWFTDNIEQHTILIGQAGERPKAPMTVEEILQHIKGLPDDKREEAKKKILAQLK